MSDAGMSELGLGDKASDPWLFADIGNVQTTVGMVQRDRIDPQAKLEDAPG